MPPELTVIELAVPRAAPETFAAISVPAVTTVSPLNVFAPVKVSVPVPLLVRLPLPLRQRSPCSSLRHRPGWCGQNPQEPT